MGCHSSQIRTGGWSRPAPYKKAVWVCHLRILSGRSREAGHSRDSTGIPFDISDLLGLQLTGFPIELMMDSTLILSFLALCWVAVKAAPIVPSEITVMEGDDATFARGLDDTMHAFLIDKATNVVLLYFATGKDMTAEKSIDVYIKDGAIIMPHVQRNYSKHYELRITNDPRTPFFIKLNVTARLPPVSDDPSLKTTPPPVNEEQWSLYISLGVIGLVVVVVLVYLYLKKKKQKQSSSDANKVKAARNAKGEFTCCIEVTGADSSASSSRSNSSVLQQEKDEEKLVT